MYSLVMCVAAKNSIATRLDLKRYILVLVSIFIEKY